MQTIMTCSREAMQATAIAQLLSDRPNPVVLEIGCNDGTDSMPLYNAIAGVRLFCFECDPRPLQRFYSRLDPTYAYKPGCGALLLEGPNKRLTLLDVAVGNIDGEADFHQSGGTIDGAHLKDWDLSGSLKKPLGHLERHKWCKFEQTMKVTVTKLDTWWKAQGSPAIDFIWLDVQGAEGDVFDGGREALQRTHYVYTEFNDYKKPLYEGDLNQQQTLQRLGPDWEQVGIYEGYNLLCRNKTWEVPSA